MLNLSKLLKDSTVGLDASSTSIKTALASLDPSTIQSLNSARSALAAHGERSDLLKAIEKNEQRVSLIGADVAFRANKDAQERRSREIEQLDLLRRSTVASEAAIKDAQRREEEAKAETRRAYAIAVVGAIAGVAGLVLAAWPIVMARLE